MEISHLKKNISRITWSFLINKCKLVKLRINSSRIKVNSDIPRKLNKFLNRDITYNLKKLHFFPAFKLSKVSVYEDRPTAKGLGILGIVLLGSFFAFIIVLDCQRIEQFFSRKRDSTSIWELEVSMAILPLYKKFLKAKRFSKKTIALVTKKLSTKYF